MMPDEIIKELWQIKEDIAREHGYDIDALVAHLRAKERREGQHDADLGSLQEDAKSQHPARSKTEG